jgi:hypothetical protein
MQDEFLDCPDNCLHVASLECVIAHRKIIAQERAKTEAAEKCLAVERKTSACWKKQADQDSAALAEERKTREADGDDWEKSYDNAVARYEAAESEAKALRENMGDIEKINKLLKLEPYAEKQWGKVVDLSSQIDIVLSRLKGAKP